VGSFSIRRTIFADILVCIGSIDPEHAGVLESRFILMTVVAWASVHKIREFSRPASHIDGAQVHEWRHDQVKHGLERV
jgi:hypothetical protein